MLLGLCCIALKHCCCRCCMRARPCCCAGMALEYKQKGTPDVNHKGYKSYGKGRRFAGLLQPQERCVVLCRHQLQALLQGNHRRHAPLSHCATLNNDDHWQASDQATSGTGFGGESHDACACRCAFHWDNINEARLLVIRPAAPGWPWSGAFPLPEREDYFGLRLRNRCGMGQGWGDSQQDALAAAYCWQCTDYRHAQAVALPTAGLQQVLACCVGHAVNTSDLYVRQMYAAGGVRPPSSSP